VLDLGATVDGASHEQADEQEYEWPDSYEQVRAVAGLVGELGKECSSAPADGGSSLHAPRRRRILVVL
jgi:hypothetical protein